MPVGRSRRKLVLVRLMPTRLGVGETSVVWLCSQAREWINTNVPKDVGAERPAKQGHCSSASVHEAQADTDDDEAPVAAASAWYLEEDIDASAVDAASQLAATQCRGKSLLPLPW